MLDIMRDAPLGQILNFISKGKIFPYPEERHDYVVPEHFLARSDEPHNYSPEERTLDNEHVEKNRTTGRGSINAGALKAAGKNTVKRLHKTDHEKNDEREEREQPRRSDSSSRTVVEDEENQSRDEEERGQKAKEKGEKGEKSKKHHGSDEDKWAYKLTADPQKAVKDNRHEHYQYLVTWNGDDDQDNPQ